MGCILSRSLIEQALVISALGCLLVSVSCGADGKGRQPVAAVDPEVQAQIQQYAMEGVSPELAGQLKAELLRVLASCGTAKAGSTPPRSASNQVTDLNAERASALSVDLDWSYVCTGDYDQNGEVNVADITEVGRHYGKTAAAPDWEVARLADGDGNGEVNISDITPVGQYFLNQVGQYTVYRSLNQADYPAGPDAANGPGTEIAGSAAMPGAPTGPGGWMQFSYHAESHTPGMLYWVRPVDAGGELGATSNVASAELEGLPWEHTVGYLYNDEVNDVAVDGNGFIYTIGTTYDPEDTGKGRRMLLQKLHPDGTLIFSKTWRMSDEDTYGTEIEIDSDDMVYTSGSTIESSAGDKQLFVQRWRPGGTIEWSYTLGGSSYEIPGDLMVRGHQVYLTGTSDSYDTRRVVLLVKLDSDGNLLWAKRWMGYGDCLDAILGYRFTFSGDTVYMACSTILPSNNVALVMVRYTPDGDLVDNHQMSMSPDMDFHPVGLVVRHTIQSFSTTVYIASRQDQGNSLLLLSAIDGSWDPVYNKTWELQANFIPMGLLLDAGNQLVVPGYGEGLSMGTFYGYAARFDRDTGVPIGAVYYGVEGAITQFQCAANFDGGVLLGGYAPDAGGTWGEVTGGSSNANHMWGEFVYDTYDTNPWLNDTAYGLINTPLNPVVDTGGGYDDALLTYHVLPE